MYVAQSRPSDCAQRPSLPASAASLAVASAACRRSARLHAREHSASGYLSPMGQHAVEGHE
jgi:hypothetical protein